MDLPYIIKIKRKYSIQMENAQDLDRNALIRNIKESVEEFEIYGSNIDKNNLLTLKTIFAKNVKN